ncbi:hypothetical protein MFMK1_002294 [Metallumcola ferriviriculae]|uniref:3'-5' exonuclease DinG n=1 Tax=Metallumcola ferriviriculae TaxID=3039180 RepID=A0AAU0UNU4_9FIRM|nr:hypothetical protein MFMK1_002294 [Desulfitibacteraceae bacterium MK1]
MVKYPAVVVLDVETSGLDPKGDCIIEVGAVKLQQGEIVDRYHSLIFFDGDLSTPISQLTGISSAELKDAPSWGEVHGDLGKFCGSSVVAGHNIAFDVGFLSAAGFTTSAGIIDTLTLARVFFPLFSSHSLDYLQKRLLSHTGVRHRALGDAESTALLLQLFFEKIYNLDVNTVHRVINVASNWEGKLAFTLALENMAWDVDSVEKKERDKDKDKPAVNSELPFTKEAVREIFIGSEGMASVFEHYEQRSQQLDMTEFVYHSLAEDGFLVVEAETGTGKTLAYLVPSAVWSLNSGQRVMISTNTLSLQQQLWEKDIPLLKRILPADFQAALIKGRTNYLCLRKWNYWLAQGEALPEQMREFLITVLIWQTRTGTGDKAELNIKQRQYELWQKMAAEGETCWGSSCTWFKSCYVTRVKRKAAGANIIVANHALVLADAFSEVKVLPEYSRLIIDEAHHFEETVARQLGRTIQHQQLIGLVQDIAAQKAPIQFAAVFPQGNLVKLHENAKELAEDIRQLAAITTEYLEQCSEKSLRITPVVAASPFWQQWHKMAQIVQDKFKYIFELLQELEDEIDRMDLQTEAWVKELQGLENKVGNIITYFQEIFLVNDRDFVTWFELTGAKAVIWNRRPINVGPLLQDFYAEYDSLVFTSATLTIANRFKFFANSLALTDWPAEYKQVASPFDHRVQSVICVPKDLPPANSEKFLEKSVPLIEQIISSVGGSTLVLFTSHKMLRDCYYPLRSSFKGTGIKILGQGIDGDRWQLVEELKNNSNAVILGAQSFWEGVDIQGDNLRCVIMMRLPFLPPTDPSVAARLEQLEEQQKNSFYHLSLPLAILRFKQGIGRLIRSKRDRGVAVILDSRIISKRYGSYFFSSLPGTGVKLLDSKNLVAEMEIFFNQKK